jgi:hypothetical protein
MKYQLYNNNGMLGVHVIASEADAKDVTPSKIVDEWPVLMGFFSAYEFDANAGYAVNAAKAQEIQRGHWREARKKLWPALDAEYFKALEAGDEDEQESVAAQKQALRDATDTEMPDDIEGIIATWPEVLPRE